MLPFLRFRFLFDLVALLCSLGHVVAAVEELRFIVQRLHVRSRFLDDSGVFLFVGVHALLLLDGLQLLLLIVQLVRLEVNHLECFFQ